MSEELDPDGPLPAYELVDAEGNRVGVELTFVDGSGFYMALVPYPWWHPRILWGRLTRWKPCRTYWGSHGCDRRRGHRGSHVCDCCDCEDHDRDHEAEGCVGRAPYYGPDTSFYGEDVPGWESPVTVTFPKL